MMQATREYYLLRAFMLIGLIACAAFTHVTRPELIELVRQGLWSPRWLFVGPAVFLILYIIMLAEYFIAKRSPSLSLADLLPACFGLILWSLLFSSSLKEYQLTNFQNPIDFRFIKSFSHHQDARVRALALLALSRHNLRDKEAFALIHEGLLDKDPFVQHAAKLVIEDNLGIRFKNGSEGTKQAQELMQDAGPSALLIRKGIP